MDSLNYHNFGYISKTEGIVVNDQSNIGRTHSDYISIKEEDGLILMGIAGVNSNSTGDNNNASSIFIYDSEGFYLGSIDFPKGEDNRAIKLDQIANIYVRVNNAGGPVTEPIKYKLIAKIGPKCKVLFDGVSYGILRSDEEKDYSVAEDEILIMSREVNRMDGGSQIYDEFNQIIVKIADKQKKLLGL